MATRPPTPPPSAPPPSGGGGIPEFLKTQIGPFPLWIWLIAGAGVAGFILIPKLLNKSSSNNPNASDPTATDAGTANAQLASEGIDPLTGVPFSVEDAINPNTGLPNYYNNYPSTNSGASTSGTSSSGTSSSGTTIPPVTNPPPPTTVTPIVPPRTYNWPVPQHPFAPNPPGHDPFAAAASTATTNPAAVIPRSANAPAYRNDTWR